MYLFTVALHRDSADATEFPADGCEPAIAGSSDRTDSAAIALKASPTTAPCGLHATHEQFGTLSPGSGGRKR